MNVNCKLTTQWLTTYGGYLWKPLEWHAIPAEERGGSLCSPSYFHFYTHPLQAAFFNTIHANLKDPLLWEVEVRGGVRHKFDKSGSTELMLKSELPLPVITSTQRVAAAILFVKGECKDKRWNEWADRWLYGEARGEVAGEWRTRAVWAADAAGREARAVWAADAAVWAARAADAAVWAARAADAAVWAARAATRLEFSEDVWPLQQNRLLEIIGEVIADRRFS